MASKAGTPKSSKALFICIFNVETHGDLGIPHFKKSPNHPNLMIGNFLN